MTKTIYSNNETQKTILNQKSNNIIKMLFIDAVEKKIKVLSSKILGILNNENEIINMNNLIIMFSMDV